MKQDLKTKNSELKKQLRRCEKRYENLLKSSREEQEEGQRFTVLMLHQQEQERKRISRELHDEIAQLLTGVNYYLGALSKEAYGAERVLHRKITTTQQLIIDSVDAVYMFAKELRPLILDDLGLVAALKSHVKDFTTHTEIPVELDVPPTGIRLDEFYKTNIFRIVQEALTNIQKHAKATHVKITLTKKNELISLKIKNNGKSFRVNSKSKKGMGISGIRERVRLAKGDFSITSNPKSGTHIKISIPIIKGVFA